MYTVRMNVFGDDTRISLEDEARNFLEEVDKRADWQAAARDLREVVIDLARIVDMHERRLIRLNARQPEDDA